MFMDQINRTEILILKLLNVGILVQISDFTKSEQLFCLINHQNIRQISPKKIKLVQIIESNIKRSYFSIVSTQ